ncbi:MAG TPA: hypothetical protein VJJ98_12040 [Sedimentisphaerales bacterium]|nr:hypothetical protein [Sedimentisphaerales bacterium]
MNEQRDEKWLDKLIAGSIDTSEPKFDAEKWKQKHPTEFQTLVDRRSQQTSTGPFGLLRLVISYRITQVAAAAAIMITIGLLIAYLGPGEQPAQTGGGAKSPAEMVTSASLRMAYNRGGMEALEKQCDRAARILGRGSLSMADLFEDLNG